MDENTRWEISKVSTPGRIFDKITKELPQPVGIILFGADCDLKDEIYVEITKRVPGISIGFGGKAENLTLPCAKQPFSKGRSVLAVLDGDASGQHKLRHQAVTELKGAGAASVVGIYARHKLPEPLPARGRLKGKTAKQTAQIKALLNDPPTPDGLDYLLTVNIR